MLIVFPLGLLAMGVIFDVVHFTTGNEMFAFVAFWMLVTGVAGGLLAAPFGFMDWLAIPAGTRAKRVGAIHGGGNLVVVALFLGSIWLRRPDLANPPDAAYACSYLGVTLAVFTGWLGGELVDRLGVGVHEGANLDAPSSLQHEAGHAPHPR
jgi:uncharacterized membrane protein